MNIHPELHDRLRSVFAPLERTASGSLPPIGYLSAELGRSLDAAASTTLGVRVSADVVKGFATAAVEVWLRALHSFLVSCSLTEASPVWASVTGYYASHYVIRAFAHSLGHFQLFRLRKTVCLEFTDGSYQCTVDAKGTRDREHKYYWRVVRQNPHFAADPLFAPVDGDGRSDMLHRNQANYADHVNVLPRFRALDTETLKTRIAQISGIRFGAPPIPRVSNFPDVESVQVVAYHRIVRFRQILDESVGGRNRFWRVHRQPTWTSDLIDFQLTEPASLGSIGN